jgi:hypothetical protein
VEKSTCPACGDVVTGRVCPTCNARIAPPGADPGEFRSLEEFHGDVARRSKEEQATLLRNGFLPDDLDVLIEAGLRCIALLDPDSWSSEPCKAARQRLEAIAAKLSMTRKDPRASAAADDFRRRLRQGEAADRRSCLFGLFILAVLLAAAIWGAVRIFGRT